MGWCGACYLVATAQMIEDRLTIKTTKISGTFPKQRPRVSVQVLLDHVRKQGPRNACHGGHPIHVLQSIARGEIPLLVHTVSTPHIWYGFPRSISSCPRHDPITVHDIRRIPPNRVQDNILTRGPIVLEIAAQTLKQLDSTGMATDLTLHERNHAVCVVGWQTSPTGVPCWIVRNSWGGSHVPERLPTDLHCVDLDRNSCRVNWVPWTGIPSDPGFCLLPMSHPDLHVLTPSPWIECDVTRSTPKDPASSSARLREPMHVRP